MTRPTSIEQLLMASQSISPAHLEDLDSSLIPAEAARKAGIKTAPADAVPKLLGACNYGWAASKVESLLAFPYPPLNGGGPTDYHRFKVFPPISTRDNKSVKYLQPAGSANHLYCPPGVDPQGKDTVYLTEGEKKSLCLTLHGFPCLGLGGVWGWRYREKDGVSKVIPDLEAVNWKRRDVVMVFDADIAINEDVHRAEAELAQELIRRKARVFTVRLPHVPGGAKGVDDYLKKHGKAAFEKLKRKSVKPGKINETAAPAPAPDGEKVYLCGHAYFVQDGRLCKESFDNRGNAHVTPLANFQAHIEEEVTKDDGMRVTKEFLLAGQLDAGRPLPPARIAARELDGLAWIHKEWGATAAAAPGRNLVPHLVNAIKANSFGRLKQKTVYAHTGWRKVEGVWRYLHGGGAIGPGAAVEVDLGANLKHYRLPEPGGIKAARASLRLLQVGPWEITAPLLACIYLAPFADLCQVDFTLWLHGPTGSLKSTLAALALAHFGNFNRLTLPGSWFSTVNSLEMMTAALKDCLCVIDDFAPPRNQKDAHKMTACAARIIYQAGNRSARGRLSPDLSARPDYYPRSLIISTAETLLPGQRQSATARYLGVELNQEEKPIDMDRLTKAQAEAHLYPAAMAAYIAGHASRLEDTRDEIRELFETYRSAFQGSTHLRIPEIQAWFSVGFELAMRFMAAQGAISEDTEHDMVKRAWKVFEALGETHSKTLAGDRPTLRFLGVLRELFAQGKVYVTGLAAPPDLDEKYSVFLGWEDQEFLYLMPNVTMKAVNEVIRGQGDFLPGRNELLAALARERIIKPGKDGRTTLLKKIYDRPHRVMWLEKSKFYSQDIEENE